jgi:hypothetical protein
MFPALTDFPLDPVIGVHPAAQRIYLRLIALLDFSAPRDVKAWVLAEELCMKKTTVIHAFTTLVDRGFLIDHGRSMNNVRRFTLAWSRPVTDSGSAPQRTPTAA